MTNGRTSFEMTVCEKDWEAMSESQKGWMLFNTLKSIETRLGVVEKQSVMHKTFAFLGGVVGGAAAAFGVNYFGKS